MIHTGRYMTDHDIHIGSTVMSRKHYGIFTVVSTRNTVGTMRPEDEMLIRDVADSSITHWDTRAFLSKVHKAGRAVTAENLRG
jgi:hypothetical protein